MAFTGEIFVMINDGINKTNKQIQTTGINKNTNPQNTPKRNSPETKTESPEGLDVFALATELASEPRP
jgi:hypothetical protein